MRRALLLLPVLLGVALGARAEPNLRVMTYNVLHGQPCAGGSLAGEVPTRMELAVQGGPQGEPGLVALAPDVVGMQEVAQGFVTQTVEGNQTCQFSGVPPGVTIVEAYEHQGAYLVRRMNGVAGARDVEGGVATSLAPTSATPYALRFVRDNPRIIGFVPDIPLPPDEQAASDVAAMGGNIEIGLAVMSKLRIQRVIVKNLSPDIQPGGTRALLHATLRDAQGVAYDFLDSHLTTSGGDSPHTVAQVTDIVQHVQNNRRHPETPGFFTCDCNSQPGTLAYQVFTAAGFVDSFAAANPGAPGLTGGRDNFERDCQQAASVRIDYVWAIPDEQGRVPAVVSSEVVMDYHVEPAPGVCLYPSDHNGVITTFDLGNLQ